MNKELKFMECDTCRAKAGTPTLCQGCIHNREVINHLTRELEDIKASNATPKFVCIKGVLVQNWMGKKKLDDPSYGKHFEKIVPIKRINGATKGDNSYSVGILAGVECSSLLVLDVDEETYENVKKALLCLKEEPTQRKNFDNPITGLDINEDNV